MAEIANLPTSAAPAEDTTGERFQLLAALLSMLAMSLKSSRDALDAHTDDRDVATLVVAQLSQLGWLVESMRQIAGTPGPLIGGPDDWTVGHELSEQMRRLATEGLRHG